MELGKKIKAIRLAEEMSQPAFSQLIDISIHSLRGYEQETRALTEENLIKITSNQQLEKYAFWLMTGKVLPESGQICPDFSIQERCGIISKTQMAKRA